MTTSSGCSASIAAAMCDQSPERVPGARPAPLPTVETSWQGEPTDQYVDRWHRRPVDGCDVAEVRDAWPVAGEDADGGGVDLGEPDRLPAGGILDGEIKAAIAGEQRPDPERVAAMGMVVVHEGSAGFVIPGPRRD